jgi:hypothetical protein
MGSLHLIRVSGKVGILAAKLSQGNLTEAKGCRRGCLLEEVLVRWLGIGSSSEEESGFVSYCCC